MNREEALKLLKGGKRGIREWNRRRNDGERIPSLKSTSFHGADLSGANLSKAELVGSDFSDAHLVGTQFDGASLMRANLSDARLNAADLRCAILLEANFSYAILNGVDMDRAVIGYTVFACDLSVVKGLEGVNHHSSSVIDVNSILHFKDELPEKFLRGCGLREEEIAYFRGQVGKAIRFYTCFISYSTKDEEFASRLHNDFQAEGIRCWKWDKDARTGKSMWGEIDNAIRSFDKLVLIASESSMKSPYVQDEIERAIQKERELMSRKNNGDYAGETDVLFPVRLDDYIFNGWEHERKADVIKKVIADARGWDTDADLYARVRDKLVKDLKA